MYLKKQRCNTMQMSEGVMPQRNDEIERRSSGV
jgi:hypothetical protein